VGQSLVFALIRQVDAKNALQTLLRMRVERELKW
jgi:hypothetical protein